MGYSRFVIGFTWVSRVFWVLDILGAFVEFSRCLGSIIRFCCFSF